MGQRRAVAAAERAPGRDSKGGRAMNMEKAGSAGGALKGQGCVRQTNLPSKALKDITEAGRLGECSRTGWEEAPAEPGLLWEA